ncbi:MAG TPA: TSUP family transporter [Burkholderiales bacterium]
MLLDASALFAVAAVAIVAAIVGGMGGFGTGIILTAALAPLIGVKNVIPVMTVASAIINLGRFWFYRASLDRKTLALVVACALPFLVLGTWIYSVLDARAIGTVLGVAVIVSIPLRRWLKRRQVVLGRTGLALGSGVFGLAHGVATGVGVILVSLLLGAGLSGQAVLATDALVSIALDVTKAALFQKFALLNEQIFYTGVIIGLATIPGSALAAWLVNRIHAHLHVLFIETLVIIGGLSLLWNSWR